MVEYGSVVGDNSELKGKVRDYMNLLSPASSQTLDISLDISANDELFRASRSSIYSL
jgi:hypothetical protein